MTERENLMFGCSGESDFNLVTRCRQEMDEPEVQNLHFEEFVSEEGNLFFYKFALRLFSFLHFLLSYVFPLIIVYTGYFNMGNLSNLR